MKANEQERDQMFTFNGKSVLVDTCVLPTLQVSTSGGRQWTQGSGLLYLASKLDVHGNHLKGLQVAFKDWSGHKLD